MREAAAAVCCAASVTKRAKSLGIRKLILRNYALNIL
jgi:hypothetical protein